MNTQPQICNSTNDLGSKDTQTDDDIICNFQKGKKSKESKKIEFIQEINVCSLKGTLSITALSDISLHGKNGFVAIGYNNGYIIQETVS